MKKVHTVLVHKKAKVGIWGERLSLFQPIRTQETNTWTDNMLGEEFLRLPPRREILFWWQKSKPNQKYNAMPGQKEVQKSTYLYEHFNNLFSFSRESQ